MKVINFVQSVVRRSCQRRSFVSETAPLSSAVEKEIFLYSNKKQTPVSLKSLMETGKGERLQMLQNVNELNSAVSNKVLIQVACFLHRELPVRLAHRAVKLEALPLFTKSGGIESPYTSVMTEFFSYFTQNIFAKFAIGTNNPLLNCESALCQMIWIKKVLSPKLLNQSTKDILLLL